MESVDPYAPPRSDVESTDSSTTPFDDFPRFSAWYVFLLGTVTLSFYYYWWLLSRTNVINKLLPGHQISLALAWVAISGMLLSFGLDIVRAISGYAGIYPDTLVWLLLFGNVVGIANLVLWFVWVFAIRNRIMELSGAREADRGYPSGVFTFLFGPVYLAYKINQIKEGANPFAA